MATIEVLLQLGEGQGIDYKKLALAGFGSGGQGALTWTDVHWAMSGLPAIERAIVYLKYNPGRVSGNELAGLTSHLWMALEALEMRHRPKPPIDPTPAERELMERAQAHRDVRQARTVQTCLSEYMDTKLCDRCWSSGDKNAGKVAKHIVGEGIVWSPCDKCQGRQWLPWSDNKRAQGCGGDRNAWKTRYERNYLLLLDECTRLYRQGAETFKERLFGPAPMETRLQARA